MAIIDSVTLNADGTMIVGGLAPFAGADITISLTTPSLSGYGQGQQILFHGHEGQPGDLDAATGVYSVSVAGYPVAASSFVAPRFKFAINASGVQVGSELTALVTDDSGSLPTHQIGEFGPIAIVADGTTTATRGQVLPGGKLPAITLPTAITACIERDPRLSRRLFCRHRFEDVDSHHQLRRRQPHTVTELQLGRRGRNRHL